MRTALPTKQSTATQPSALAPTTSPGPGRLHPTQSTLASDIRKELTRLGYLDPTTEPAKTTKQPARQTTTTLLFHAAIAQFQHEAGLLIDGAVSAALLANLIMRTHRPRHRRSGPATVQKPSPAIAVIKAVQQALAKQGYITKPADGRPRRNHRPRHQGIPDGQRDDRFRCPECSVAPALASWSQTWLRKKLDYSVSPP